MSLWGFIAPNLAPEWAKSLQLNGWRVVNILNKPHYARL